MRPGPDTRYLHSASCTMDAEISTFQFFVKIFATKNVFFETILPRSGLPPTNPRPAHFLPNIRTWIQASHFNA